MSWPPIDLSSAAGELPGPGNYPATISDIRIYEKPDVVWLNVEFTLDNTKASPRGALYAVAATEGSRYLGRVVEGLRFLLRLSLAVGIEIADADIEDLPSLLLGKRLEVTVAHSMRDGMPDLVVRSMRPLLASK
jgi:hypothetical protein